MEQVAEKTKKKMEIKISEAEGNSEREDICRGKGNMRSARAMSKKVEKKNGFGVSGGKYRRMKEEEDGRVVIRQHGRGRESMALFGIRKPCFDISEADDTCTYSIKSSRHESERAPQSTDHGHRIAMRLSGSHSGEMQPP